MQKPNSYDTTQAAGEFEPIALGGHKMVIKQVSEKNPRVDLICLLSCLISQKETNRRVTL